MLKLFLIFSGGGLGALARYKLGGLVLHHTADWRFPLSTFLVNVLGCLVAGVLAGLVERQEWFSPDARLFLFTGLLGGFTTFSAFGLETAYLLKRGQISVALAYAGGSVLCGVAALWLGMAAVPHSSA
jgi:CrcB protein